MPILLVLFLFEFYQTLVDCAWGEWQNGTCSKTCGGGELTHTRTKLVEAAHGGKECNGEATETVNCNTETCPSKRLLELSCKNK